jgi:uncharacterized protein YkwD
MIRQTGFGIALSTVVLASGLTNAIPTQIAAKKVNSAKPLPSSSQAVLASSYNTSELEKSIFERVNSYRASKGLSRLTLNSKISRQARVHSQNMASGKVPFSHNGFEKRVKSTTIRYQSAAENVAFNQGYDDPAVEAMSGWIKSPGHLKNLKGNYNLTGIGVATNKQGQVYLTQIFILNR